METNYLNPLWASSNMPSGEKMNNPYVKKYGHGSPPHVDFVGMIN